MKLTKVLAMLNFLYPLATLARLWTILDSCPTSIETQISDSHLRGDSRWNTMASVHATLKSCPDITSLDLRVFLNGCSGWPDRWNFPFNLEGGETYPSLRALRLEGYNFEEREWQKNAFEREMPGLPWYERALSWVASGKALKHVRQSILVPEQRNKTNLQLWLDAMDWSQLESLSIETQLELVPHLRSLRKLDIHGERNTLKFIQGLDNNSLTHLTWNDHDGQHVLPAILAHHGASLQHLDLHRPEVMSQPTPVFDNSILKMLTHQSLNISHLGINIHRNGTWPLETLGIVSSIPSLRSADLWLDIVSECRRQKLDHWSMDERRGDPEKIAEFVNVYGECEGEDQYQKPLVNETSALQIFKFMRGEKKGEALRNVTFWVGDWSRPWDGPLYFPEWIEGKNAKVVCSVQDEGNGELRCREDRLYMDLDDGE